MHKQFQIRSFSYIRMESSVLQWRSYLMTKFQEVMKFRALCRLFHSFSFGASFPVSIEEFLWDLSFIVKHLFLGVLGLETWRTSPEFFAWGKGRWIKTDRRMHSTLFHPSPLLVIILFLLLLIKAQSFTIHKVWMFFQETTEGTVKTIFMLG